MYKIFAFLCTLLVFSGTQTSVNAQGVNMAGMCDVYDSNGAINYNFLSRHPVHVMGLTPPGMIGVMNARVYTNPNPLEGTFEPLPGSYSWQYNDIFCVSFTECYMRFLKSIPRVLGVHHVVSEWRSRIHLDQYLSKAQLGGFRQLVESHYTVAAEQPIIFEHLAIQGMVIESREYGINTELTSFAFLTAQGKFTVLSEILATNMVTGMAEYSITDYVSDPNGHLTYNTIYRPLAMCSDPDAPEGTAFACASIQAFLDGSADLYLAEDPLAAAAGYPGLQVLTYTGPVTAKRSNSTLDQVRWVDTPMARVTYSQIVNGQIDDTNQRPMRYVPGMHVSRDEHARRVNA